MVFVSILINLLLLVLAIFIGYLLLIPFGAFIPVNRAYREHKKGVDVFVSTNGMHTDFIVPVRNQLFDWTQIVDGQPFDKELSEYSYLGIGWGDPGFYLELEAWNKLTTRIMARAMLIPTSTIMHVIGYEDLPYTEKKRVEKIVLSKSQYVRLCSFIYSAFALKEDQELDLIPGVGYTENDNFYQAQGVYHAFHTCNYWVNKGLKRIGVRTALWSPFDRGIFYQLDKIKPVMTNNEQVSVPVSVETH